MAAPKKKDTLSKALSKRPKLEAAEWDFRWIKNDAEALAVYRYEIGREILREARYALKSPERYEKLIEYFSELRLNLFSPINSIGDGRLAYTLSHVAEISEGQLISGLPPSAYLIKKQIRKQITKNIPHAKLLIRRQPPGVIDPVDIEHGPDKVFELIFSDFDYPTKKEAKQILNKWVDDSKYFQQKKAGRHTNPLVRLAAYRYSQGEDKPQYSIEKGLNKSEISEEPYGKELFKKYFLLTKASIPASSWSDDINQVKKVLRKDVQLLSKFFT